MLFKFLFTWFLFSNFYFVSQHQQQFSLQFAVLAKFSDRIPQQPLFLFTFEEGQYDIGANQTFDVSGRSPSLVPYLDVNVGEVRFNNESVGILCPSHERNGFVSRSPLNVNPLTNIIATTKQFSMEMWFQPYGEGVIDGNFTNAANSYYLGVFGLVQDNRPDVPLTQCTNSDTVLSLFSYNDNNGIDSLFSSLFDSPSIDQCQGSVTNGQVLGFTGDIIHVVATVTSTNTSANLTLYGNGEQVSQVITTAHGLTKFNNSNSFNMRVRVGDVLSTYPNTNPTKNVDYEGNIFLASMYDFALTPAQVLQNYDAGLPNSRPIAFSDKIMAWSNYVTNVTLFGYDYDPNDIPLLNFTVTSLPNPERGQLYLSLVDAENGQSPLKSNQLPFMIPASNVDTSNGIATLYFVSQTNNGFGLNYANFSYTVNDQSSTSTVQLISIDVEQALLPPTLVPTNANIYCGINSTIILSNVISTQGISSNKTLQYIVSLPINGGHLFINGDLNNPVTAADIPATIYPDVNDGLFKIIYSPTVCDSQKSLENNNLIENDSFNVTASFTSMSLYPYFMGATSSNIVSISVWNPLKISSDMNVVMNENTRYGIELIGFDVTGNPTQINFVSLPSKGYLYTSANGDTYVTSISQTFAGNSTLYYEPFQYQYGLPNYDSFSYYVSSTFNNLLFSPSTNITIGVNPVYQPVLLQYSCEATSSPIISTCPPTVAKVNSFFPVKSLTFTDPDVTMSHQSPLSDCYLLNINPNYLQQIPTNLITFAINGSTAEGVNSYSNVLTYNDVNDILSTLQFASPIPSSNMIISIAISDIEFGVTSLTYEIPSTCMYKTGTPMNASLEIYVFDKVTQTTKPKIAEQNGHHKHPFDLLYLILIGVAAVTLAVLVYFFCRCKERKEKRDSQILQNEMINYMANPNHTSNSNGNIGNSTV